VKLAQIWSHEIDQMKTNYHSINAKFLMGNWIKAAEQSMMQQGTLLNQC